MTESDIVSGFIFVGLTLLWMALDWYGRKTGQIYDRRKVMDCPRCALGDYGMKRRPDRIEHKPTMPKPPDRTLELWMYDSVCEATDGCTVEPDGHCEHGHRSWLLVLRLI